MDRVRRKRAVLGGLYAWSLIASCTSLARGFLQLLAFTTAEGVGESFYYPASMSMISEYHSPATRSRAMGLHQTSVYVGTVGGAFFAGLIGQRFGWRWSFVTFGALGVMLGLLLDAASSRTDAAKERLGERALQGVAHAISSSPGAFPGGTPAYGRILLREFCGDGPSFLDA